MEASLRVHEIVSQISYLNDEAKKNLISIISEMINKKPVKKETPVLTDICGLGAEIWVSTNVDSYIENERQWD